jgi:hypothetical protein
MSQNWKMKLISFTLTTVDSDKMTACWVLTLFSATTVVTFKQLSGLKKDLDLNIHLWFIFPDYILLNDKMINE